MAVVAAIEHERGNIWNDPEIDIDWPEGEKIHSEKDRLNKLLKEADIFE